MLARSHVPAQEAPLSTVTLATVRATLSTYRPQLLHPNECRQAAVALILGEAEGELEVLLIERARRQGDPWSGHMAFPGGRRESTDATAAAAAERETREELGLTLTDVNRLGRIDDMQGRHAGNPLELVISCFVYAVERPLRVTPNDEVQDALWIPLSRLLDPTRTIPRYRVYAPDRVYPGLRVTDVASQIVWGLTYRFLGSFFDVIGRPLPPPAVHPSPDGH